MHLELFRGTTRVGVHALAEGAAAFTLGRHPHSTLRLDAVSISTHHLYCTRKNGKVYCMDTSTNGTFLNGVKMVRGQVTTLEDGAVISPVVKCSNHPSHLNAAAANVLLGAFIYRQHDASGVGSGDAVAGAVVPLAASPSRLTSRPAPPAAAASPASPYERALAAIDKRVRSPSAPALVPDPAPPDPALAEESDDSPPAPPPPPPPPPAPPRTVAQQPHAAAAEEEEAVEADAGGEEEEAAEAEAAEAPPPPAPPGFDAFELPADLRQWRQKKKRPLFPANGAASNASNSRVAVVASGASHDGGSNSRQQQRAAGGGAVRPPPHGDEPAPKRAKPPRAPMVVNGAATPRIVSGGRPSARRRRSSNLAEPVAVPGSAVEGGGDMSHTRGRSDPLRGPTTLSDVFAFLTSTSVRE